MKLSNFTKNYGKSLFCGVIFALSSSFASAADTSTSNVVVSTTAPPICSLAFAANGNANFVLANPASAALEASSFTHSLSGVYCNTNAVIFVKSDNGGMTYQGTKPNIIGGNWIKRVGYSTSIKFGAAWGGVPFAGAQPSTSTSDWLGDTQNILVSQVVGGANSAPIDITINIAASNELLLSGTYSDNLTLTILPII